MADVKIDGIEVCVDEGTSILEAARSAGVYIPALCAHPSLPVVEGMTGVSVVHQGDTRFESDDVEASWDGCGLCVVEADGELVRACTTSATEGLTIVTGSDRVVAHRQKKLAGILAIHPHACLSCAQAEGCPRTQCSSNVPEEERCCELLGSCELGRIAHFVGIPPDLARYRNRGLPRLTDDPLFDFDTELCAGCLRCVRACGDLRGVGSLGFVMKEGRPVVGTTDGTTRSAGHCRFCGACVEVCPTGALLDRVRAKGTERENLLVPCRHACPAGIDIPRLLRHVAHDEPCMAAAVVRERVPLAFAASYTCFHPCEDACRRNDLNEPVSVCRLKRYALDRDDGAWRQQLARRASTGKTVAVVGSGPAGLTAAWYLALKGHDVTVHEALPEPGGMLLVGIPEYRFPRDLLAKDIEEVRNMGVSIRCNSPVDSDGYEALTRDNDAVFVATGAHEAKRLDLPGCDLPGVYWGVDFLRERALGELARDAFAGFDVAVVGGGNVAIDAARVAKRLGAVKVTVVSLESAEELPAWDWEVEETLDEGIDLKHAWGPLAIRGSGGQVAGLELKRCTRVFDSNGLFDPTFDDSETADVSANAVILAIGQDPSSRPFETLGLGTQGTIHHSEETLATKEENVWAGGDVATGPGSFIHAVAQGRTAASGIDRELGGDGDIETVLVERTPIDHRLGRITDFPSLPRSLPNIADGSARAGAFTSIEETFETEVARAEAMRCLNCDLRLALEPAPVPPARESVFELNREVIDRVPASEGVFQLMDGDRKIIDIKGVMDMKAGLSEALEENDNARFFVFEEDPMFTKRESELIQLYLQEHGELPGGGDDELDDLF